MKIFGVPIVQFDNRISIGNLLTVGVLAITIVAGYLNLQSTQAAQSQKLAELAADGDDREARLRVVEIAQASIGADIRSIQSGIDEIKSAIIALGNK